MNWVVNNTDQILANLLAHLALSVPPILLSFVISLPFGWVANRYRWSRGTLLTGLGVLYAIVGWDIIGDPLQGVVTLTVVISIVLIVEGIIRIFTAISGGTTHRGLVGFVGVINLLLGLWLWSGIPVSGVAIGFFVGFELVLAGIVWIMGGWMSRSLATSAAAA